MNNIQHKALPPQIFNLQGWIKLTDESLLKELFHTILTNTGFSILNYSSHQFPINGFTAFWLLSESHLALHTFTESGWCYIELSSCNSDKSEQFKTLAENLGYPLKWEKENIQICHAGKSMTDL
jgi:S-adenosylmethionine decarboxylase